MKAADPKPVDHMGLLHSCKNITQIINEIDKKDTNDYISLMPIIEGWNQSEGS